MQRQQQSDHLVVSRADSPGNTRKSDEQTAENAGGEHSPYK